MKTLTHLLIVSGLLTTLAQAEPVSLEETDAAITINRGDTPILTYHKADVPPPKGVDPVYNRSGFIHPLHAPSGGTVTGIHPNDHYHHLGLWHAWVKTKWNGREIDFWNLKKKQGRIRFSKVLERKADGAGAGFTALQEHVAYVDGADADPTVILEEKLSIKAVAEEGMNVLDYTVEQTNVTEHSLKLPGYRYGGCVAFRGPLSWNKENSDYLTSEGKDRTNSHGTRSKWCAIFGPAENGEGKDATVLFLGHPDNHDAPQQMRTWDNGKIFFNYVPAQKNDWEIPAGGTIRLKYRIVVFDGKADEKSISAQWKAFAGKS